MASRAPDRAEIRQVVSTLHYRKAQALYDQNQFAQTVAELEKIPPLYSLEAIQYLLARAYIANKKEARAIATINNLLKLKKGDLSYRFLRAQAYAGQGKAKEAIDDLSYCISRRGVVPATGEARNPEACKYVLLRAKMYDQIGEKNLAQKDRNLIKADSDFVYREAPFRSEHK